MQIDELLKIAIEKGASDVFITVGVPPIIKVNGELIKIAEKMILPADSKEIIRQLFKSDEEFDEFLQKGEKDFSYSVPGLGRFRVGTYMQRGSVAAAIRVLKFEKLDATKLGITPDVLSAISAMKGLVLVTGPTGSGKTTTLSTMIDKINSEKQAHIITLEDPIEYIHKHNQSIIDQREVGIDTKSYADGLRSVLRQAPDVILIGEMRDYETMQIALTAAETGHLVLSTLHTTGAAKTVDRIIDVFPPNQQAQIRVQLSTVLASVISQKLVKTKSGELIPVFEIMQVNSAIKNLIRDNKVYQMDTIIHSTTGMQSMDFAIANLVKQGIIDENEAFSNCMSEDSLKRYLSVR